LSKPSQPASYLERYLEPFRDLLLRDDVVEIAINPDGKVWIEAAGDATMRHEGETVDRATAFNMAQTIVGDANARVSEKNPLVSGKVEYAGRPLRVQVAVPPAIEQGASITIRLFATGGVQGYTPSYLFGKAVSLDQMRAEKMKDIASQADENLEAALEALVHQRLNVLISGGTSTGKTTFARHLLTHVDDGERLITIEDAFELFPSNPILSPCWQVAALDHKEVRTRFCKHLCGCARTGSSSGNCAGTRR
jgi:type IV secretion system protein VirB11